MFWDKEKIISVYETSVQTEGDPYIRTPKTQDKDPSTRRADRETGEIITLWEEKLRYPYKTRREANLIVETTSRTLTIPLLLDEDPCSKVKGFFWNGQNIPELMWSILGISKDSPCGLLASKWHDFLLYRKKEVLAGINGKNSTKLDFKKYRRLTNLIYRELLKNMGIGTIKANIMSGAVAAWQFVSPQWWGME
jgi:hypothetical protein